MTDTEIVEGDTIDAKSLEFIKWCKSQLNNPMVFDSLISEIRINADTFFYQNREQLLEKLEKKLIVGAFEHGEPIYGPKVVEEEINNEFLDLIGWSMIKKFNELND